MKKPSLNAIPKIQAKHLSWLMPLFLSALMSGSLAGFNLFINGQLLDGFISKWFVSCMLSWLVAIPLILIFIPLVIRFLMLMVKFPKQPTK